MLDTTKPNVNKTTSSVDFENGDGNKPTTHWWLRDKPIKRARMSTLYRFAVLYMAETGKSASEFVLWLEKYMEYNND